jgi:hypothetical protein
MAVYRHDLRPHLPFLPELSLHRESGEEMGPQAYTEYRKRTGDRPPASAIAL